MLEEKGARSKYTNILELMPVANSSPTETKNKIMINRCTHIVHSNCQSLIDFIRLGQPVGRAELFLANADFFIGIGFSVLTHGNIMIKTDIEKNFEVNILTFWMKEKCDGN